MRSFPIQMVALACLIMMSGCRSTSNLKVVSHFELDRYLGQWYEAARFPHRFEKGLVAVTADYNRNSDGTIKVVNRGYNPTTQEWEQAVGVAKFKDDSSQGWLKVSFFGPFYASYKILYLDDDYTEAVVTGPSYNYLWILVRDPAITKEKLDALILQAANRGFDTSHLEIIPHSIPAQ